MGGPHFWASDLIKLAVALIVMAIAIRWISSVVVAALPILIPIAVAGCGIGFWRWRQSSRGGW